MLRIPPTATSLPEWVRRAADAINQIIGRLDRVEDRATVLETFEVSLSALNDYSDDAAAATGGVPVGGFYRTASVVKVRVA